MRQERGIISMLTAIMVSILLIIMALGIVGIISSNGQQASDEELSSRAFASAEGGVEYAASYLLTHPNANFIRCGSILAPTATDPTLDPALYSFDYGNLTDSSQNQITCLTVNSTAQQASDPVGLGPNSARQLTLEPNNPTGGGIVRYVNVNWDPHQFNYFDSTASTLPSGASTDGTAAIEVTIVKFHYSNPVDSPFSAATAKVDSGSIHIANTLLLPSTVPTSTDSSKIFVKCTFGGAYPCQATIDLNQLGWVSKLGGLLTSNDTITVSIRSKYAGSDNVPYSIMFKDTGSNLMQIPLGQSTIDVTARAGQVYRRLIASSPTGPALLGQLNYVLFGDANICKTIQFYNNTAGVPQLVSPICPGPPPAFTTP